MADLGNPQSWLVARNGTVVYARRGENVGALAAVVGEQRVDIFDGIVIRVDSTHRFAEAELVEAFYERGVLLVLEASAVRELPEPARHPGLAPESGEVPAEAPHHESLEAKLHRAWEHVAHPGHGPE